MRLLLVPALLGLAVALGVTAAHLAGAPDGAKAPAVAETPPEVHAPMAARHHAGGASPVRSTVRIQPYAVTGHSVETLLSSLREHGPVVEGGVFFGLTATEIGYRFGYRQTAGSCETVDARVDILVSITLPEWQSPPGAPYELKRDWQRFAAALRRHEERHRDLALEGAYALQRAIQGLRAPTCDAAAALAARQAERLQIEAEARHRQYDDATGHGETEGALWPPQG